MVPGEDLEHCLSFDHRCAGHVSKEGDGFCYFPQPPQALIPRQRADNALRISGNTQELANPFVFAGDLSRRDDIAGRLHQSRVPSLRRTRAK